MNCLLFLIYKNSGQIGLIIKGQFLILLDCAQRVLCYLRNDRKRFKNWMPLILVSADLPVNMPLDLRYLLGDKDKKRYREVLYLKENIENISADWMWRKQSSVYNRQDRCRYSCFVTSIFIHTWTSLQRNSWPNKKAYWHTVAYNLRMKKTIRSQSSSCHRHNIYSFFFVFSICIVCVCVCVSVNC